MAEPVIETQSLSKDYWLDSGKSTLMSILGCLDTPSAGRYLLQGRDVSQLDDDALARMGNAQIGFVFQQFNLMPRMSALANVELPLIYSDRPDGQHRRTALAKLEAVGLGDRAHHRPAQLSGGQRVAIARALVNARSSSWPTSPPAISTRGPAWRIMAIVQALNRSGITSCSSRTRRASRGAAPMGGGGRLLRLLPGAQGLPAESHRRAPVRVATWHCRCFHDAWTAREELP